MLRIAAEFADTWNSWGGFVDTEEEAYRRTVDRAHRLDGMCIGIGRDPASIGRSFLVFESTGNYEVTPSDPRVLLRGGIPGPRRQVSGDRNHGAGLLLP
jgi:hypothetical protein